MVVLDLDALPVVPSRVLFRSPSSAEAGPCDGGWFLREPGANSVRIFDVEARPIDDLQAPTLGAHAPEPVEWWNTGRALAVDRAGSRIAVAVANRVVVCDATGQDIRVDHPRWRDFGGALAFDPTDAGADLLWLTVPTSEVAGERTWTASPSGALLLINARTGTVIDRVDLDDEGPAGYGLIACPGHGVVLRGAYGQDGSTTWCARTDGTAIELRQLQAAGIANSFDADRGEILYLPHSELDVEIRTWWDDELVARSSGLELFGPVNEQESYFGYIGAFIDDRRVAVQTLEAWIPLVLDRVTGQPLGRLVLDADDTWPVTLSQVGPERLLCEVAPHGRVLLVAIDRQSSD